MREKKNLGPVAHVHDASTRLHVHDASTRLRVHDASTTRPRCVHTSPNMPTIQQPFNIQQVLTGGQCSYSYSEGGCSAAPVTYPPVTVEGNTRRELAGVPGDGVLASFNESRDVVCIDDGSWKEGRAGVDQYLYEKRCKRRGSPSP